MENWLERSIALYGEKEIENLKKSHVAVFGAGGVGSYAIEALARAGVGEITVVDSDVYSVTNINRQLFATTLTVGRKKVDVAKERILSINPSCKVNAIDKFVLEDTISEIDFSSFSFVIDAIDTISGKLGIIKECKKNNVPIISSMGTGNKTNPTLFKVADISKTKVCPLAKAMRKLLKEKNISNVTVLYSEEEPKKQGNKVPSSNSFVPAVAGLILAGTVINNLAEKNND